MADDAERVLQLKLEQDTFTVAQDLLAKHEASKNDSAKVTIKDSYFSFNTRDFRAMADDYLAMQKALADLDIDVRWKEPPKKARTRLSGPNTIPKFLRDEAAKAKPQSKAKTGRVRL
jgi:hypothetical protein